jgi:hypothetical protein
MAAAMAYGDSSTMPNGTQFSVWQKPVRFTKTYHMEGKRRKG